MNVRMTEYNYNTQYSTATFKMQNHNQHHFLSVSEVA